MGRGYGPGAMNRDGWTCVHEGSNRGCGQAWQHDESKWQVIHCGHPTAVTPWYGVAPDGTGPLLLTGGLGVGTGFKWVRSAMDAVEAMLKEKAA